MARTAEADSRDSLMEGGYEIDLYEVLQDLVFHRAIFASILEDGLALPVYLRSPAQEIVSFNMAFANPTNLRQFQRQVDGTGRHLRSNLSAVRKAKRTPPSKMRDASYSIDRVREAVSNLFDLDEDDLAESLEHVTLGDRLFHSLESIGNSIAMIKGVRPLPPPMPEVSSGSVTVALHSRVQEAAGELIRGGHLRQALFDAATALFNDVAAKAEMPALNGTGGLQAVFSPKTPVLRCSDQVDEQQGYLWLFSGMWSALRNPRAHHRGEERDTDLKVVKEWLVFLSALYRILDEAELVVSANESGST